MRTQRWLSWSIMPEELIAPPSPLQTNRFGNAWLIGFPGPSFSWPSLLLRWHLPWVPEVQSLLQGSESRALAPSRVWKAEKLWHREHGSFLYQGREKLLSSFQAFPQLNEWSAVPGACSSVSFDKQQSVHYYAKNSRHGRQGSHGSTNEDLTFQQAPFAGR